MASLVLRGQVLRAYRDILRAQRGLFGNDAEARMKALQETRRKYDENRNVTDEEQVKSLIKFSYECKEVLEGGVVQGTRISDNTYRVKITEKTWKTKNTDITDPLTFGNSKNAQRCCKE